MDKEVFDNNDDNDYTAKVESQAERVPRTIKTIESYDNAGGKLEIVQLDPRPNSNRRARWKEERQIRVWTPPGYHKVCQADTAGGFLTRCTNGDVKPDASLS